MSDKRQIVGPVLRKPEAPPSREGHEHEWRVRLPNGEVVADFELGCASCIEEPLADLARERDDYKQLLDSLARQLAREREAHAATGLSERLYQESLAKAQGELRTAEAALAALHARYDALVREARWFVSWIAHAMITPREAAMDQQAQRWVAAHPAPQTEAPGGVPDA